LLGKKKRIPGNAIDKNHVLRRIFKEIHEQMLRILYKIIKKGQLLTALSRIITRTKIYKKKYKGYTTKETIFD
jgi:hypothetical protein